MAADKCLDCLCARQISNPSAGTAELFDMFYALYGATSKPRLRNALQIADVIIHLHVLEEQPGSLLHLLFEISLREYSLWVLLFYILCLIKFFHQTLLKYVVCKCY